ncbi:MAG: hypothetical protein GY697_19380 [Desulfobacterales bacterium]|nr:hypothetical protein [Desulfobacterales bacterium]
MQNHPARSHTARRKKMAIITSYFTGETYGLLGPQAAATVITRETPFDCIVVTVTNEDDKQSVKMALYDYFGTQQPVIGFSYLSGRQDLVDLAADLKAEGAITLLAGPQADVDFSGETGCDQHAHRFPGLADHFSFALHGPAQQIVPLLKTDSLTARQDIPGILYLDENDRLVRNPEISWAPQAFIGIDWHNLYHIEDAHLAPRQVTSAQVLQQLGCPWAARQQTVLIDYPAFMDDATGKSIHLNLAGCSFCDVATDKGLVAGLPAEIVIEQILALPETPDGRKIPFELINENPLPGLPRLLDQACKRGLKLSRINLTLRADWLLKHKAPLEATLETARKTGIRIVLASIGFESFSDTLLHNLNKGLSVATNLAAIDLIRQMKNAYPEELGYLRSEGGNHGFIHPTPWDTPATESEMGRVIAGHGLAKDILPDHSTPLIIQHASGLGDWIRAIETRERVRFTRIGAIVAWWDDPLAA